MTSMGFWFISPQERKFAAINSVATIVGTPPFGCIQATFSSHTHRPTHK